MVQKWTALLILIVLGLGVVSYGAANLILYTVGEVQGDSAQEPARWLKESETRKDTVSPFIAPSDLDVMVPHKATYVIEMIQKRSGAQIVDLSGTMTYEWKSVCDAWVSNHRFDLVYVYPDAPPMKIQSDFTTYEPHDGSGFDFNSRRRRDGELYEELRGNAQIAADKKSGIAFFNAPEGLSYDLPENAVFPMRHAYEVLQAINQGKRFYSSTLFDGSDDQGPAEVNAFLGQAIDSLTHVTMSDSINSDLLILPAHRVRLAFFPLNLPDPQADYEMDVVLHPNGIISDMRVEYQDFSVSQRLTSLESVSGGDACAQNTPQTPDSEL